LLRCLNIASDGAESDVAYGGRN